MPAEVGNGVASLREMRADEFEEAGALVDRAMRPDADFSMADDFPLLVGRATEARRLVVVEDGKLVSHAASRTLRVSTPGGPDLSMSNIGAVCSDPSARKRGHARTLVTRLMEDAAREGAELAILWTDIPEFYAPFGFHEVGCETQFGLDIAHLEDTPEVDVWQLAPDEAAAKCLHNASEPFHLERSPIDTRILFDLPLSETFAVLDGDRVATYAVFGKGLDFQGVICEWGGDVSLLPALALQIMLAKGLPRIVVIGPGYRADFASTFEALGCPRGEVPLAMMAILDREAFVNRIRSEDPDALEDDDAGLLLRVFGSPDCPSRSGGELPWPFYVWGLDSM